MSQVTPAGTALAPALPLPYEVTEGTSLESLKCILVFLIAFTLGWLGLLGYIDYFWTDGAALAGPLISPPCAAVLLLCGAIMLTVQNRKNLSRTLAAILLATSASCFFSDLFPVLEFDKPAAFGMPFHISGIWTVLFIALSMGLIFCSAGPAGRRIARYLGIAVVMCAMVFRFAPSWLFFKVDSSADTANIATLLSLLAGFAVIVLSSRHKPESVFAHKTIAIIGILGALMSTLGWYAVTGHASQVSETAISLHPDAVRTLSSWHVQPWVSTLPALLADIVLFIGLAFTFFLIRTKQLASGVRYRSIQLHYRSLHDPLTSLPNKLQLERVLTEACLVAKADESAVWVVLFDLDGMKLINDSMGHSFGDRILVEVAQRMRGEVGKKGCLARMGGDEFVVVFVRVGREEVLSSTRRIVAAIAKPYYIDNMQLRLTASAGITVSSGDVVQPMELVREADLAMTRAKRDGRNTWYEYTSDLSSFVAERLALRTELQKALDEDSFDLFYQPLVDGYTGRIVGVEALLRWPHPTRGYISPAVFIPLAEETGQIIPLSDWVLNTACRHIKTLRTRNLSDFPVMVNISPLHFQRADFIDSIRKKLQTYSLPSQCLEIEITEGVLLDNAAHIITKLGELKKLGVAISLDDFGTGYSSLNYLKNLPIDKIKIDRSFVREVISDRHDAAITKAIIDMAHHLNLKVVAEGVETESQYWFLKRNFCDEFQGYLFAKPMSFGDLEQRLKEQGCNETLPGSKYKRESDRTLLLLDDEENILKALTRLLRRDGYRILLAKTPSEAFSILATHNVQVVVSDQRMPEMTGTEFFSSVKEIYPGTVRLILSGYTDLRSVTEAINRGSIYKFLTKPWDEEELRGEIAQAFKGSALQEA
ncbi:MAG TPA: EAL domain-containing protein [Eoetvoesiella sp.]